MREGKGRQTAVVRVDDLTLRLRRGDVGESFLIVEPLMESYLPAILEMFQVFANGYHPELRSKYIPHEALAVAELIAEHFGGEVLEFSQPEGTRVESNVVY